MPTVKSAILSSYILILIKKNFWKSCWISLTSTSRKWIKRSFRKKCFLNAAKACHLKIWTSYNVLPSDLEAASSTFLSIWQPQVQAWGNFQQQQQKKSQRCHLLPFLSPLQTGSPSRFYSLCLFLLVSSEQKAPQTVFTPPQAPRRRHRAAKLRPLFLFMDPLQPKYV